MAKQTILFTVIPRGVSLNPTTLPVSVVVNPRLYERHPPWATSRIG